MTGKYPPHESGYYLEDEEYNVFNTIGHTPYQSFFSRNSLRRSCAIPHCFYANEDNTECQICNTRETGLKLFDDFIDDNFEFYYDNGYIEYSQSSIADPFMFELMLSFYKVNMEMGEENYYLSPDKTCVERCDLVEPKGMFLSLEENITVEDAYGNPVTGKQCSCGPGWSRIEENGECFDC